MKALIWTSLALVVWFCGLGLADEPPQPHTQINIASPARSVVFSTYWGRRSSEEARAVALDTYGYSYVVGSVYSPLQPGTSTGVSSDVFVLKVSPIGELVYASRFGGSLNDQPNAIAVDRSGGVCITGITFSQNFPLRNALQTQLKGAADIFLTCLDSAGAITTSTYFGGSDYDNAYSMAIDKKGFLYVAGTSASMDFPLVRPLQRGKRGTTDGIVVKMNPAHSKVIYSTYLGGSWSEDVLSMSIDLHGCIYLTGETYSADYPLRNAAQGYNDWISAAFVTRINPGGQSLGFSTLWGGKIGGSMGTALAVDSKGNVAVTGNVTSFEFPVLHPFQQFSKGGREAFLSKFDHSGKLMFSTYLGGSGGDGGNSIGIDCAGQIYVLGDTNSIDFPLKNAFQRLNRGRPNSGTHDAFLTKVSPDGKGILSSTYFGGAWQDESFGVSVRCDGTLTFVGKTKSDDFPVKHPIQPEYGGKYPAYDAFVVSISHF